MSYEYTSRDGQRVEVHVAAALDKMNAAFQKDTGYSLKVNAGGGTRTRAEQESIFRQRYVTAGAVAGRKVYDIRRWKGVLWYRISSAGTVAIPGSSNHEEDGPNGPRSLDLSDTGPDRGVMTRGTARDKWMEVHAHEYGFANEGYNFGEPWHKTFNGALSDTTPAAPALGGVEFSQVVQDQQAFLIGRGFDLGKSGADGKKGSLTTAAFEKYQTFLRAWGYTGPIDGDWGSGTQAAHQKFFDSLQKPATPPASTTRRATIRKGSKGVLVTSLQNRLNRDYPAYSKLRPDGDFGDATDKVVRKFQGKAGLKVDGIVGPATWGALGL